MITSKDFQRAIDLIDKSDSVMITTHTKPDGDACGCIVAMCEMLTALGKQVNVLLLSPAPTWYEFLFTETPPILGRDLTIDQLNKGQFAEPDLIIILDTNSRSQLPDFEEYLKTNDKPVLVLDHHVTSDNLGSVELIDTSAAATGLIVLDLLKYADRPMTAKIAEALFVAVATDTGWFQFSNTDSRALTSTAQLIEAGANLPQIYHNLYQNYSYPRFKLMTAMLNTVEIHLQGRLATQYLTKQHFEQTGAAHQDTENLIDECRRIATVEAAALFVELDDGRVRCSLRSRGAVDVRKIAQKFGGGGHKMASGLYLPAPIQNAIETIKNEVQKALT